MNQNNYYSYHYTSTTSTYCKRIKETNYICYDDSIVQFDPHSTTGLSLSSCYCNYKAQHISFTAEHITLNCPNGILEFNCHGAIEIYADKIELSTNHSTLYVDDEKIECTIAQLELQTPQINTAVMIACQGDTHHCPQSNGPNNPHIGGLIMQGSSNVSINGKGIARHNDLATCQQHLPNSIISHLNTITVNGKAIVHQQANTQHGGSITTGQQKALLNHTVQHCATAKKDQHITPNELFINCSNKKYNHVIINFAHEQQAVELQQPITTLTNLTTTDLTQPFQIQIT